MQVFKKDSLIKNISLLVSGTVMAQLIPILLQPILKRIFTPEDFGVFDIYLKVLGILVVVYAFKYEMAIILPKNRVKALLLLTLSAVFSLAFTLITTLIIWIFNEELLSVLGISSNYSFALYILPFSVLFFSLYNALNYLLIRNKKFVASSINKISRRSAEGSMQIGISFFASIKSLGLFVGDVVGNVFATLSAFYQNFGKVKFERRFFNIRLLKHIAKEYSDLPKYNIIPELLNAGFLAAVSFLVLTKFDIVEVGYMELTQRILAIPTAFIAYSVGQVLLQKVTEMVNNKEKILKEIWKIFFLLLAMTIPFVLIIVFFAEPIFGFVFGKQWIISGTYSRYLIVFYALAFLVSPLSQVLISLQEFKVNAMWKIGRFFLIIPLFMLDFESVDNYLISYSILGGLSYVVYFFIVLFYSKKYDDSIEK